MNSSNWIFILQLLNSDLEHFFPTYSTHLRFINIIIIDHFITFAISISVLACHRLHMTRLMKFFLLFHIYTHWNSRENTCRCGKNKLLIRLHSRNNLQLISPLCDIRNFKILLIILLQEKIIFCQQKKIFYFRNFWEIYTRGFSEWRKKLFYDFLLLGIFNFFFFIFVEMLIHTLKCLSHISINKSTLLHSISERGIFILLAWNEKICNSHMKISLSFIVWMCVARLWMKKFCRIYAWMDL